MTPQLAGTDPPAAPTTLLYAEDLAVGTTYSLGTHTPSRQEITDFARRWDPLPLHLDATDAAASGWGDIIASGAHTIAIFQRLSVSRLEHEWAVIAGIGLEEVRFLRPVRPDEPLTGHARIDAIDMVREDRALVVKSGTLTGPEGGESLTLVSRAYVRRRPVVADEAAAAGRSGGGS